jgi:hypothetical protein
MDVISRFDLKHPDDSFFDYVKNKVPYHADVPYMFRDITSVHSVKNLSYYDAVIITYSLINQKL